MDIKLPKLGEGAESGTVANLLVKEGDQIKKEQPLIELESEKAVASIPSPEAGTVKKIHVSVGDSLSVGQTILSLESPDQKGDGEEDKKEEGKQKSEEAESKSESTDEKKESRKAPSSSGADVSGISLEEIDDSVEKPAAPPSVRFIASQLGLDLRRVKQGKGSRVSIEDLQNYLQTLQKLAVKASSGSAPAESGKASGQASAAGIDFGQWGSILKKPMSQLRKVIARRMTENWNTIPHITQFDEADIGNILSLRKKHVAAYEKKNARLTVTSFILKVVADTLKKHQEFNASLDESSDEIILKEYVHLGLAVDSDAGLMVPVIRDVDKKDMVQLSVEVAELAEKVRSRKIGPDEMKGGTFTISNQGAFGGAHFTPIINHPEVAILGLGKAAMKPVVRDGKIEQRTMLPLALSYDHRVIDGGSAARFMVDLVQAFESFEESVVNLQ